MNYLQFLQNLCHFISGRTDSLGDAKGEKSPLLSSPLWGLWWGILLIIALIFCGQSSKFIYIDF
jgi:hypothetical protein